MPTPSLTYAQTSHRGLQRADNQDSYGKFPRDDLSLTHPKGQLFLVADGMGGHQGGREASQMAVHLIAQAYADASSGDLPENLRRAFHTANTRIHQRAHEDPALAGMGTTCTALALKKNRGWIAHVGDSRAYRITPAAIVQLTHDHSQVEELVRQSILTKEQAAQHPQRNVLSRALGARPDVEVDVTRPFSLHAGEHYLLCSDGLALVPEGAIQATVLDHPPQEACDLLVQAANDQGGHDNVTVLIVKIDERPDAAAQHTTRRFGGWRTLFLALLMLLLALILLGL